MGLVAIVVAVSGLLTSPGSVPGSRAIGGVTSGGEIGVPWVSDPFGEDPEPTAAPSLSPGFGPCPGAPPIGGGMERRPDHARDAAGVWHMVWQERIDGQFEVCYAAGGDFGVGADRTPGLRITDTPGDSVDPSIAIDAASGLAYVVWVEEVHPMAIGAVPVMITEAAPVLAYVATDAFDPSGPLWSAMQALADGGGKMTRFFVDESRYTGVRLQQGRVETDRDWNGEFDTDGDGLRDSDEVLAVRGFPTKWWNPDTDDDRLPDLIEIENILDPTLHVTKQFPECFPRGPSKTCDMIFQLFCLYVDLDGDGFSLCGEGQDFPVTTEVAGFTHGGSATYRFWPKMDGAYDLVLRTEMRTYSTAVPCVNVSVAVVVDGAAMGTWTRAWNDTNPPWSIDVAATFEVTGIDFTAVTAAQAVDVDLTVSFDPPGCGEAVLAIVRQLALDWLKLELSADRSEVNYKDADDFTDDPAPPSFLVDVTTEDMVIQLNAVQKDLLLELDSMAGHAWDPGALNEAINVFSDHNIILNYKVSETGLATSETVKAGSTVATISSDWPPTTTDESSQYLAAHRDASLQLLRYVHVMNAHRGSGCGMAEQAAIGGAPEFSGVIMYDQDMIDNMCGLADIPDLFSLRLVVLVHELAHVFNTAHETSSGFIDCVIDDCTPLPGFDTCNAYNIEVGGGYCSAPALFDKELLGIGNTDRRFGATSPIGRPRYSIETEARIDLTSLLSVETENNVIFLDDYV